MEGMHRLFWNILEGSRTFYKTTSMDADEVMWPIEAQPEPNQI